VGFLLPHRGGSVGTVCVLLLSLIKKDMSVKVYLKSAKDGLRTASMLLMLIAGSAVLGHFIAATNIPKATADWVVSLPVNRYVILILITIIYQIGGSFIDDLAFVVLATPIFYPAVLKLGFDPIWFCMIIAVTVMIGVVIPPMAICVFVVKNITKTPFGIIYRGVYPFLIALFIVFILLMLFPQIALWLPSVLIGA
jgi:C4-dicarboxylate transporter DctM subunit